MSGARPILDRLAAKAGGLYSLPAVAMEVLELTERPDVDARALKQCIENDPALTAKLLRVVNSSLFGLGGKVSDLNQALALLGIKPLKLLVLGFSLPANLFTGMEADVLGYYWRHTLAKAVAAREICEFFWKRAGDEAFIAGLLQDIGILVLSQQLGEPYMKFLKGALARGGDLAALEMEVLRFDHIELTTGLLQNWGLPDALVVAIGPNAEDRPRPENSQLLNQILRIAEELARFLATGRPGLLANLMDLGRTHGVSPERIEDLAARLDEKVRQLAHVLSLQLPEGSSYRDLLLRARSQLAAAAEEAAADLLTAGCGGPQQPLEEENRGLLEKLQALSDELVRTTSSPPGAPPAGVPGQVAGSASVSGGTATAMAEAPELEPGLLGRLAAAVAACRQSRCPLSLLLVELDDHGELLFHSGSQGYAAAIRLVESTCSGVDHPQAVCVRCREAGFAVILPDCDRQPAVRLANQLLRETDRRMSCSPAAPSGATLSVGAATVSLPPKNFPASDLLAAAERCLYGSRASGGGMVKSIEIY